MGKEVKFVDVTVRDGNQSLWDATGLKSKMILDIAETMDQVGFKAIDFISSIHMGMFIRKHKEDPWQLIRLANKAIRNTPLSFGTTGRRFIGFKLIPNSIMELVLKCIAANGIRRLWIIDAAHEIDFIWSIARMAKKIGFEEVVVALSFSISPVHTDEYYAEKSRQIAKCPDVDTLYIKDQGGLLTPERIHSLVPAICQNSLGKPLEIHSHCNTGLAPICYLEAVRLGIEVLHTAVPPLAYGSSLPSIFNILMNLQHLGYKINIDTEALQRISEHFNKIAEREGRPKGVPVEYNVYYYEHQVPGGMVTTLRRQLAEIGMENRLEEVLEEVVRVRKELGYPIMVTPFSQFVGTQATMNVIKGERYKVIPDGVLQYVAGWFGPPPAPIDPDVLDKIHAHPRAKEFLGRELPQPSVKEIRRQMKIGTEVSDEEFLLRYVMTDEELDPVFGKRH